MHTGASGIALIKRYESCKLKAYILPGEQYYTIGWGHYGSDVKAGMIWTQAKADSTFVNDLLKYEAGVKKYISYKLNQNEFDALVSFDYNLGASVLNPSTCTLARLLNKGDVIGAGNEFPNWTGSRSTANRNGLLARRLAEKALFLTPTATTLANKPVIITPVPSLKTVVPATPKTPATTTPAKVTGSPAPAKTPVKTSVKMLGLGGLIGVAYFIFGTD